MQNLGFKAPIPSIFLYAFDLLKISKQIQDEECRGKLLHHAFLEYVWSLLRWNPGRYIV